MPDDQTPESTQEAQELIREKAQESDCATGTVIFPDHDACRVQIVLTGKELTVDLLNHLNQVGGLPFHVVFVKEYDCESWIVEVER